MEATPTTSASSTAPAADEVLRPVWEQPSGIVSFLTSVDHKRIGVRYLVTATAFFLIAGVEALAMRTQLAVPRADVLTPEAFNEFFSMHGVTMIFLFVTPMLSGFGNYFVPLMVGARDMAFPRLNALSYWVFLASGLFIYSSFTVGQPPTAGWFNYTPLSSDEFSGAGIDFYNLGLIFLAISTTVGAVNFIVTIFKMRAPGMSMNRVPLFCWGVLVQAFAIIFALPALTAANLLLELQRTFDFHFFDPAAGGDPVLWQHLFWIFGHPDVYIIFLPAIGIVSSIVPVFSRRALVGHTWVIFATVAIGLLGFGVWVHHMFAVGLPQVTIAFFAGVSLAITIPSGIQIFAWLATMLRGRPVLKTPMLFIVGFIAVFVVGGVTGVMFAAIPFDQQITDSYFVVAHFHYVLMGGAVFPIFAAIYYWLPKISGKLLDERLGKTSFWLIFIGFNVTFFPMHISGLLGMPRRVYTYDGDLGWDSYNLLSTIGAFVLALGVLAIVANVIWSIYRGRPAGPDPWEANTLEWATPSPTPAYNFGVIPRVSSPDPNWDTADREADRRLAAEGELLLADEHQAIAASEVEGEPVRVMHMPEPSIWPLAVAVALSILFVGMITQVYLIAVLGALAALGAIAGWHRPHEELQNQ
ncbi:MAG TPA: cytochrome c oxidase subunit I [Solirubrobacterales bacterium]|nr:cytochrome c oxidase subunit I [Solirubrobacterales bacterium]